IFSITLVAVAIVACGGIFHLITRIPIVFLASVLVFGVVRRRLFLARVLVFYGIGRRFLAGCVGRRVDVDLFVSSEWQSSVTTTSACRTRDSA
ncbi:MAG: hypothetical protein P8I74_06725, partial [Phycisphaerales bacterium]|nr:hypothetical protein [Phycisphaerales bacterium]